VAKKLTKRALAETSVEASPAEVARTIEEIFSIVGIFFKRQNIDEKAGWVELHGERRDVTLRSWGEKVKVEIIGDRIGGSTVRAESKAILSTTIFDYGQNKDNLKRIFALLTNKYQSTSPLVIKEKTL
jgi:hypothetical protein